MLVTFDIGKDDFALLSNSVTFPSNARLNDDQCFDILIIGDNFIETDEVFNITISTVFPDFVGDPSSAMITITHDGDGKANKTDVKFPIFQWQI